MIRQTNHLQTYVYIECLGSCDQKPYLHNETKGGICIKIEFNPQKNISLLQDGRRFFVYSSNMAAVTSCEHTLLVQWAIFELCKDEKTKSKSRLRERICIFLCLFSNS